MKYRTVLVLLIICLCFSFSPGGQAQAILGPQGPTATIVKFGIYEIVKKGIQYEHKESTAGYAEEGGEFALVKNTTEVPLMKGIVFGIEWEAQGLPNMPIKITYRRQGTV